jgi:glycosyltransferase involved in cell wall biosynthesis
MKIAVCLLTYNRKVLFLRTLNSLYNAGHPYSLHIYDNGSTDGTADIVREVGGHCNGGDNHTTGHGMNAVIDEAMRGDPDLIVFTADDFRYTNRWLARLVAFWQAAPADIVLVSCYLEPMWPWNAITELGNAGGERYAVRDSIPGSNWTFRTRDAALILPVSEKTGGEDLEICRRLRDGGRKLAALHLVEHIGERDSAWGNESWRYSQPIDPKGLGFNENI